MVKELQHLFTDSQVLIFTDYRGLSVADITNLRRQLREKGVEYHVTKNTLTTLAADKAGLEEISKMLDGPTAIAFVHDDIPGAAKVLADFVRTSRILQIRGGLMGRTVMDADQVSDLQKILSREQYIAKILGSMQSPMSGMVGTLTGVIRNFMNVMQARVDQLKEQGGAEEAEAETAAPTAEAASAAPEAEASTTQAEAAPTAAPEASAPAAQAEPSAPTAEAETRTAQEEAPTATAEAETTTEEAAPVASLAEPEAAPEAVETAEATEATEATEAPAEEASEEAAPAEESEA